MPIQEKIAALIFWAAIFGCLVGTWASAIKF